MTGTTTAPRTGGTLPVPDEFLNPASSIAPGAAGVIVLIITNAIGAAAGIPRAATALVLSGIIGALIVSKFQGGTLLKLGYWVVNSLTIFAIALGSNATLTGMAHGPAVAAPSGGGFLTPWL